MTKTRFLALFAALVLLFTISTAVFAQKVPPHVFVGTASGATVTAWINGALVATTDVADGSYVIQVEGVAGDAISFQVDGADADETGTWEQGGATELNLTAGAGTGTDTATEIDTGTGADGKDGSDGSDGRDGSDGSDGRDGTDGAKGGNGADGDDGAPGAAGSDGAAGKAGAAGAVGPAGADGSSGGSGLAIVALILGIIGIVVGAGAFVMGRRA